MSITAPGVRHGRRLPRRAGVRTIAGDDEDRADGDGIAVGSPMRVIATVRPEGIFDVEFADDAEVRLFRIIGVVVSGLALVSQIEPAGSAAVGSTVRHRALGGGVT
jgi:hypothetical protein